MSEQKQKLKLKNLLNEISFSSEDKRREWDELADYMDGKELSKTIKHFEERKKKEKEIKLKLIVKYGLQDSYVKGIDKLSQIFVNKAKAKEIKK